ncbi:uroporphyrinogen-III synthase [Rhodohalobacter sp. 8-1]|uniref:uroporphyrinogen-III synthase n=1 Tax=Rhodohalobacter sp. 8-1 TaxID=3131972 RepID=UPI0030ED99CA
MSTSPSIFITRELSAEQLALAGDLNLHVVMKPAINIEYRSDWLSVQTAVEQADQSIFVFTSQNGVKAIDQFRRAGIDLPEDAPVYAVGSKTKEALVEAGFRRIKIPDQQNGVGLAHLIIDDVLNDPAMKNRLILHFCGNKRRDELRHYLTESDITVKDIVVYKTELNQIDLSDLDSFDGILFYSPSSVQAFRHSGGFRLENSAELFAIGPTTAEELSIESGQHVHISPQPDTEVFLKFVARVLGETGKEPIAKCPPLKGAMGDENNLYYNKNLKNLARNLRNDSTKAEIRLWSELLRGKHTGYTFLRQRPVLNYIADFLCKDLKLIIELDGYSHEFEQQWKKDKERQAELEEAGFKILRFTDDDVMNDLRNVESEILYWIKKLKPAEDNKPSPPSPKGITREKGESSKGAGG